MTAPLGKTYPAQTLPDGRVIVDLAKCPPAEPEPTTYFGLPVVRGRVPLEAIKARDFWPRWQAIMADVDADDGLVSIADVLKFARAYVLEI